MSSAVRPRALVRLAILTLALLGTALPVAAQTTAIRVNAGGLAYTDTAGNSWSADTGYNTGTTSSSGVSIAGTSDPTLFQSNRWDDGSAPELQYSFSVPNGPYLVKLYFAETWSGGWAVGHRIFDVQIEGQTAFHNLDVYAEAGANAALIRTTNVEVSDGQLNIEFLHGAADNPFVSAIEILSAQPPNPAVPTTPSGLTAVAASATQINLNWSASTDDVAVTGYRVERCQGATCNGFAQIAGPGTASYSDSGLAPSMTYRYRVRAVDADQNFSPYSSLVTLTTKTNGLFVARVNAGGSAFTDSLGNQWSADTGFNTGNATGSGAAISGTPDPMLFQSNRWDTADAPELQYTFAAPEGWYDVNLYFAETWSGAFVTGNRVFNVQIEGQTAIQNLDVFAQAGANAALRKSTSLYVSDGQLNIAFLHVVENPFVCAIEVIQTSSPDVQAPTTPTALTAESGTATQAALSWNPSSDNVAVTGYRVERCESAGCTDFRQVGTSASATYTDSGLTPLKTYRYRVRAADAIPNLGAYAGPVAVTTPAALDTEPPSAPTGLVATATSNTQVHASWGASTDNDHLTGYRVERCQGSGCSNFTQVGTSTGTSFNDGGLQRATSYRYRVRAVDAVPNFSSYSNIGNVTTLDGVDTQAPTVPVALMASAIASTQINMSWSVSTDDTAVTGYLLERCQGPTCTNFLQIGAPSGTTFSDSPLSPSTTYRYRVRAHDAVPNNSGYSSIRTVTTTAGEDTTAPTAPASLSALARSTSRVNLAWPASTDDVAVAGYRVERCEGASCTAFAQVATVSFNTYADTGLTGGTTYRYRVLAMDEAENLSSYSPFAAATTIAGNGTAGSTTYQYDSFGRLKQVTVTPQ